MTRLKRPVLYVFIILFLLLILYIVRDSSIIHAFDKRKAIDQAQNYCTNVTGHLNLMEPPHDFVAELLTCNEIKSKTSIRECNYLAPDAKAWLVSMDGQWELWGPPNPDGTNVPIQLTRCYVVIGAGTGIKLDISWK